MTDSPTKLYICTRCREEYTQRIEILDHRCRAMGAAFEVVNICPKCEGVDCGCDSEVDE